MALKTDCTTPEWIIKRELIMKRRAANNRATDLSPSAYDKTTACSEPLNSNYAANVPAVHPGRSDAPRHSSRQPRTNFKTATQSPARGSVPGTGLEQRRAADAVVEESTSRYRFLRPTTVVNGGVRQRWLSADQCQRRVMGEDACQEKSSGGDDSVSLEPLLGIEKKLNRKDFLFEYDQEFEYGPGIVDKLKTKFINLSLQETKEDGGNLRRFSSLENLLENDYQATDFAKRKRPMATIGANGGERTLLARSGFKRAKSMETLLFESEQKVVGGGNYKRRPLSVGGDLPESVLINENLVIIESEPPNKSCDLLGSKVVAKKRDSSLSRQTSVTHINDEELPKPDIVKTCKLIFEPAVRRAINHNSARKAPVVRHSAKNWANNNRYASSQHAAITEKTETVSLASPKTCAKASSPLFLNGDAPVTTEKLQNGDMCEINNDKNKGRSPSVKRISDDAMTRIRSEGTSLNFGGKVGQSPKKSPTLSTGRPKVTTPKIPSPVRNAASRRAAAAAAEVNASRAAQKVAVKPASEVRSPTKEVVPVKADHVPDVVAAASPAKEELAPVVAPAMPEEPTELVPPPLMNGDVILTPVEDPVTEKREPVEEDLEILKPSTLLGNKKPLWQKPPPTTTTMVFDFRGKDVKSHLPVNPAPFGCKPAPRGVNRRKKRSTSPPLGDGTVLTNGAINGVLLGDDFGGDSKDYDDDDEEYDSDELDVGRNLPHPSGIVFAGGNVVVGRGSLLATRNKKLKIQFNDGATSVHEYQSEASAIEDYSEERNESPPNNNSTTSPSLVSNSALSSSTGLANYTPSMFSSTETFQLGLHRPVHEPQPPSPCVEVAPTSSVEEELKPADPDETSSWSSSTTSDLLF